jgi:predicted Fe-S protein YdhL (DUF1289 family)
LQAYPEGRHVNTRQPGDPSASLAPLPEDATPVPSPCIGLCRMVPATGLCEGCTRTIEEIAGWRDADDATRRAVWAAIRQRRG